jgi:hypothetical protein
MDGHGHDGSTRTRDRPLIERMIAGAAKAMIAIAVVFGALAGLALMGVASFGPAFSEWSARQSPRTWLLLAFVVWPVLGVLSVGLEALFEGAFSGDVAETNVKGASRSEHQGRWGDPP